MRVGRRHATILAALLAVGAAAPARRDASIVRRDAAPAQLILWTWDRPEDLRFLADGDVTQIAYLAGTIRLRGEQVDTRPRFSPLALRAATRRRPVVRIEVDGADRPRLDDGQRLALLARIDWLIDLESTEALQIDFDAPLSARPFYRALLADLRARLPRGAALSMTALASWCLGDDWLAELEVDEVVPMFFRMGRDDAEVRARLARREALSPPCRQSAGITLDEPAPPFGAAETIYAFSPRAWTADDYLDLRAQLAEKRP